MGQKFKDANREIREVVIIKWDNAMDNKTTSCQKNYNNNNKTTTTQRTKGWATEIHTK